MHDSYVYFDKSPFDFLAILFNTSVYLIQIGATISFSGITYYWRYFQIILGFARIKKGFEFNCFQAFVSFQIELYA